MLAQKMSKLFYAGVASANPQQPVASFANDSVFFGTTPISWTAVRSTVFCMPGRELLKLVHENDVSVGVAKKVIQVHSTGTKKDFCIISLHLNPNTQLSSKKRFLLRETYTDGESEWVMLTGEVDDAADSDPSFLHFHSQAPSFIHVQSLSLTTSSLTLGVIQPPSGNQDDLKNQVSGKLQLLSRDLTKKPSDDQ